MTKGLNGQSADGKVAGVRAEVFDFPAFAAALEIFKRSVHGYLSGMMTNQLKGVRNGFKVS